jgi:hypothetical protein
LLEVDLIDAGAGFFLPEVGDQFTVLTSLGNIIGKFDKEPISMENGMNYQWSVLYNPHDVILELASISVPEPTTAVLALMSLVIIGRW